MNVSRKMSSALTRYPQKALNAAWPLVTGWRGLLLLAGIAVLGGITLNWSWLVALGIAPALAVLPCVVMCGLGFCMLGATGDRTRDDADKRPPREHRPE